MLQMDVGRSDEGVDARVLGALEGLPRAVNILIACAAQSGDAASLDPASITSTPRRASCRAISNFCSTVKLAPGDCSPSRNVVSKTTTRSGIDLPPHMGAMARPYFSHGIISRNCAPIFSI